MRLNNAARFEELYDSAFIEEYARRVDAAYMLGQEVEWGDAIGEKLVRIPLTRAGDPLPTRRRKRLAKGVQ